MRKYTHRKSEAVTSRQEERHARGREGRGKAERRREKERGEERK